MILIWVLITLGIVALVRWLGTSFSDRKTPSKAPLDILQERYARGEIDKKEYEQKRRDLEG